jgi:exo-1,4-beta-D-glucosaminidase
VNSSYEALGELKVSAKLYGLDAKEKGSREGTLDVAADSSTRAFEVPSVSGLSTTYFLRLQLHNAAGKLLSDNFYWLSTKPDTLNWKARKDTVYTPQAEFGDLSGLNSLPQIKLEVQTAAKQESDTQTVNVTVRNPSGAVAFMVHMRITKGRGGEDVTPIFWQDNYFSLLPGESREVRAKYDSTSLSGKEAVLQIDGFNIAPATALAAEHQ